MPLRAEEPGTLSQAEALRSSGHLREAAALFMALSQTGDPAGQAVAVFGLGNVQLQQRRRNEAARTLRAARLRSEGLGLHALTAAIDNSMGMLLAVQGRGEEAGAAYAEARRGALAAGDAPLAVAVLLNRARLPASDPAQAGEALAQALAETLALPDSTTKGHLLLAMASARCPPQGGACAGPAEAEAVKALEEARRIAGADHRLRSQSLGRMGRIYEGQGRDGEALELTRQAIAALPDGDRDLMLEWEWQRGRLLRRQAGGEVDAALAYRRAVHHIEAIRLDIPVEYADGRSSFRDTLGPIYLGLADLLLHLAEENRGDSTALLREARGVVERVKVAELNDYFRDQCISAVDDNTELEGVASGTAVLYPIVLPDRLVVLVSSRQGIRQFVAPVKREEVRDIVSTFRRNLQHPEHNRFIAQAEELYARIIAPVEPLLAQWGTDTLVVVPDGVLRTIPFATLYDGERFLIERYALVTSPGLNLTDPKAIDWTQGRLLLAGLSAGVQGFSPLPAVPAELGAIREQTGGDQLLDSEYVLLELEDRFGKVPYSAVHFATHGQFTGDPDRNFLLTYDDRLTMDRLEALITKSGGRERPLELLTMSACQTALGDDRAALGLAGLAVKAGARSAVATLWFVDDEAAATAMIGFYRQLLAQEGGTKAKALQQAQLELVAQERFWHPAYWGPFLLIGNWL